MPGKWNARWKKTGFAGISKFRVVFTSAINQISIIQTLREKDLLEKKSLFNGKKNSLLGKCTILNLFVSK